MGKVNRHNHPLMVNARKESHAAGYREGFEYGYKKGLEERCDTLKRHYEICLGAFKRRIDTANTIIEKYRNEVK